MEVTKKKAIKWVQEELDIFSIYELSTLRWANRLGLTPEDLEKIKARGKK